MFLFTIIIMYRNLHCNKKMNNELERSYKNYQGTPFHIAAFRHILDQSICTLISNLSGRPDICLGSGTSKKLGPKYRVQKAGCKKIGSLLLKKRRGSLCTLLFATHSNLFLKFQTLKKYQADLIN